ncbi:DDE superfamily endonuclease [Popillia japonica]|uniref:DDE superfamily endonuclease n=1 Tax=Popillia japonica TaxID=7064 RepID=A0AAW1N1W1_POPJA
MIKLYKIDIGTVKQNPIPIPMPKEDGISYICRKNFPCLILQAVCNHRLLFTHCYAGEEGSIHDATVRRRSEVWEYMTMDKETKFPRDTHIIGDKAYPCTPQLLTPYKDNGHLTVNQKRFNYRLSKCIGPQNTL